MLNTESLSFPDCRHFLQLVTVECIYILQKIQIVLKVDTTFSFDKILNSQTVQTEI